MFIVKIKGTELHFGIKEFAAVTGLKYGLLTDYFSDPSIPNRLITKYFGEMNKPEDRFKIGVLYFISTFFTGSKASKTTIPKLYFDVVESDQLTLKAYSRRLENNPTSFKFSQFHLVLQSWFYECCHPFDNTVAICVANDTPRIPNWKTSNESIFFDDLKNTIFRTCVNHMNAIDRNNLHQSSSHHKTENQATSERNDVDFDEKYVELKKEIAEVRVEMKELKDNDDARQHVEESEKAPMDQPSVSMREYIDISNTDIEALNSIDQTVGVVFNADIPGSSTSKPPTLDDYPNLTMTQIVELDPIINANTTPDVQPRNRNPGKYDTSPYIQLSEGESILRRVPISFVSNIRLKVTMGLRLQLS
ncbi:hypothetical protein R3W88_007397 [Solanum pinnatisectum]|uniref:DUF1985 domain-containing protein n=1 Tax=Solanum pinnatisectum TaxID=50273 RepID=A0AAV9M549_9SOLN|nr:hypothetical protein R3W88_007397 [Solanum pinnatisectum]